jgi:peptidoglycan/LPS O-acetylase OafA/YrhL
MILYPLTSLRFFAALMIVIHHCDGLFGIKQKSFLWGQGVSFFFVLSGFILTYVYLPQREFNVIQFWKARVARILPAHIACLALGYILVPYSLNIHTLIANIFMVHAFLPIPEFYFSYNSVSWSISVELFFYLCFPFLIFKFSSRYKQLIGMSIVLVLSLILISQFWDTITGGWTGPIVFGNNAYHLSVVHGLLYISPLSRLLEFVIGMYFGMRYLRNLHNSQTISCQSATILELLAFLFCVLSIKYSESVTSVMMTYPVDLEKIRFWFLNNGSLIFYGNLIYRLAIGKGWISRLLKLRMFVFLGEISFSMYLLHQILMNLFRQYTTVYPSLNSLSGATLFMTILVFTSFVMWIFIEKPARAFLLKKKKFF